MKWLASSFSVLFIKCLNYEQFNKYMYIVIIICINIAFRFDPERFSPDNVKLRPALSFEPFGFAGKRKCLGYKLSYAEAFVLISTVIQKFKINLVEGQVVTPVFGLVASPKEEIWITLSKRD